MKSKQMALSGLLCALALVLMVLASAIGVGTFIGPMLAMAMLLPILEEYGWKTMLVAFAATAALGFLLVPEREMTFVYAAFGWYPVLRPQLNRIPGFLIQLILKALLGGIIIFLLYGVLLRVLGMATDLEETAIATGLGEEDLSLITEAHQGYVLKFRSLELWENLRQWLKKH